MTRSLPFFTASAAVSLLAITQLLGAPVHQTVVSIDGRSFRIDGQLTYTGRSYNGMRIEGLMMNSRMVQGIFDDPLVPGRWAYPDGPWDPDRNTRELIAAMPEWRRHGLLSFTINLQGGSPWGYGAQQPWINSAFDHDGNLKPAYMARLEKILDKANQLGMAPILGFFYNVQERQMKDEAAVVRATENATDWILSKGYTNVLIEIANECDMSGFEHEIIKPARAHELIRLVQTRSAGKVHSPAARLLVSTSLSGGAIPPENIVAVADFVLLHGNTVKPPARIRQMVDACRQSNAYRDQPILFNEDDHFDFELPENNLLSAVAGYASWGYFDYRFKGESYEQGFQSVPADWGIGSNRKRGFFSLLARLTGSEAVKR